MEGLYAFHAQGRERQIGFYVVEQPVQWLCGRQNRLNLLNRDDLARTVLSMGYGHWLRRPWIEPLPSPYGWRAFYHWATGANKAQSNIIVRFIPEHFRIMGWQNPHLTRHNPDVLNRKRCESVHSRCINRGFRRQQNPLAECEDSELYPLLSDQWEWGWLFVRFTSRRIPDGCESRNLEYVNSVLNRKENGTLT